MSSVREKIVTWIAETSLKSKGEGIRDEGEDKWEYQASYGVSACTFFLYFPISSVPLTFSFWNNLSPTIDVTLGWVFIL